MLDDHEVFNEVGLLDGLGMLDGPNVLNSDNVLGIACLKVCVPLLPNGLAARWV